MKPVEFPGVNVVFAKDQPEYMPLPAMKIPNDPQGLIITKWQLSPEELERIKKPEQYICRLRRLTNHCNPYC